MSLYRDIKRELNREPDNRMGVAVVLSEQTRLTKEEKEQIASLFWYLQEQLDDAAKLCGELRAKILELQQ